MSKKFDFASYEKLGVITTKSTNGFGVYEVKDKKIQIDKPCKVGDVVVKFKNSGKFGKVFVVSSEEFDFMEKKKKKEKVSEDPEIPKVPEIPEIPKVPEIPEVPEVPEKTRNKK